MSEQSSVSKIDVPRVLSSRLMTGGKEKRSKVIRYFRLYTRSLEKNLRFSVDEEVFGWPKSRFGTILGRNMKVVIGR